MCVQRGCKGRGDSNNSKSKDNKQNGLTVLIQTYLQTNIVLKKRKDIISVVQTIT